MDRAPAARPAKPAVAIWDDTVVAAAHADDEGGDADDAVVRAKDGGAKHVEPAGDEAVVLLGPVGRTLAAPEFVEALQHGAEYPALAAPVMEGSPDLSSRRPGQSRAAFGAGKGAYVGARDFRGKALKRFERREHARGGVRRRRLLLAE